MAVFELAQCYVKTDDTTGEAKTLHVRHGTDWDVIDLDSPDANLDVIRPLLDAAMALHIMAPTGT